MVLSLAASIYPAWDQYETDTNPCRFGGGGLRFFRFFGQVLGIDVAAGKPHHFQPFNFKDIQGFVHKVQLQVTGFNHWISVDAVFIESEVMPILGQQGFFESYQVVFEWFKRQFEINTETDAMIRNKRGYGRGR